LALRVVLQPDFDLLPREVEVHVFHPPVLIESQQQRVMLGKIVHASQVINDSTKFQPTGLSHEIRGRTHNLERKGRVRKYGESIPNETIEKLRKRSRRRRASWTSFSKDRVSRIVSAIGQEAGIIVRQPDEDRHIRIKYASAHDLRRSLSERLYNKGMSAETLMVIMRHRDFSTTRKYYQAKKRAEAAAIEVHQLLGGSHSISGLVGGNEKAPSLTAEELMKLKALLNAL